MLTRSSKSEPVFFPEIEKHCKELKKLTKEPKVEEIKKEE